MGAVRSIYDFWREILIIAGRSVSLFSSFSFYFDQVFETIYQFVIIMVIGLRGVQFGL